MLFELEQGLEEEIEMLKKRRRTIWVRSWCARREEVGDCSNFSNLQRNFSLHDKLRRGVLYAQFHPQLVSQQLSSALRCRLQENNAWYNSVFTDISSVMLDSDITKKSGRILIVAELAREYGFKDVGG